MNAHVLVHHIVEAHLGGGGLYALWQGPRAQLDVPRGNVVAVNAAARAAFPIVARKRGNERIAMACHIVVRKLVDAAHAIGDD